MNVGGRLVLGTAQLGMPYGVANVTGKPDDVLACRIVEAAWALGIREFDTAQAYGDSEQVLGRALAKLGVTDQARIVSKLDPKINYGNRDAVRNAVSESMRRLGVRKLYGLMIHDEDHLEALEGEMGRTLRSLTDDRMVEHVGISVYSPRKALKALSLDVIEIIQVPANVLDRRMRDAGVFTFAREKKKQVYVRSVFLQGVLLMSADELPSKLGCARDVLKTLRTTAEEHDTSLMRIALGYVRDAYADAKVVFGAELPEQVRANCTFWKRGVSHPLLMCLENAFPNVDERIVDPRQWVD